MVKPNRLQLKRLQLALENRDKAIPLVQIFISGWKFYLVFLIVFGGGALWLWTERGYTCSALLIGIILGVLWRDFTYAQVSSRFKPISDFVTDWEKVKTLIHGNTET